MTIPVFTIHFRLSSAAKFTISGTHISPSSTILQIKELVANEEASGNVPVERQRLIYKGRILSDDSRTLSDYGVNEDNQTIHLVKGGAAAPSTQTPPPTALPATTTIAAPLNYNSFAVPTPSTTATASSSNPFASPNLMQQMFQMQQQQQPPNLAQMQQQMMNNPELLNSMMNNPMVQNIMSSPDFMRTMMENNPQMRQVLDSNPELRNVLQDPEFMRRSMEMMRDPNAMRHMMRNQDLAMSQIENMPGGFNALRRMYEDVQEPLMNAMTGAGSAAGGGSSSSTTEAGSSTTNRTTTERSSSTSSSSGVSGATGAAMPNPWGSTSSTATSAPFNPWSLPSSSSSTTTTSSSTSSMNPWSMMMGGNNPTAGVAGMPTPSIEQTLAMMENPMFSQMMNQMMANPAAMQSMMESNPMLRQLRETNPEAAALMSNPEYMRSMMNPDNLRAMMQMQNAMEQLNRNMPGSMSLGGGVTPSLDFSSLLSPPPSSTSLMGSGTTNNLNPWSMWMPPTTTTNPMVSSTPTSIPPEQRFQSQLQSLNDMGFDDNVLNIRILIQTHGNVNRAVELLLSGEGSTTTNTSPST